jgi:hypothetical protein
MKLQVKYLWVLLFATLLWAPALKAGEIFVSNDEWMFTNDVLGLSSPNNNDAQFAQNIAGWLTGGSGKILIDSSNFGLNGADLNTELTNLGYTVTETPGATNFSNYNAVFVGGNGGSVNNAALISYVNGGGSVFVEAGTGDLGPVGEAAEWNTFLNAFGLSLAPVYNGIGTGSEPGSDINVSAFQFQGPYGAALFTGVDNVFIWNGNDVSGAGPGVQTWTTDGGDGLYGAWQGTAVTPEPVSMLLMGTFLSLAGGLLSKKKRAL